MRPRLSLPALVFAASLAGCATLPDETPGAHLGPEELLERSPIAGGRELPALPDPGVLALDGDMREFLARNVQPEGDDYSRLFQLLSAVISPGSFGVEYREQTLTAAGTFHARAGNCLSFTNLFIALSRGVGLDVTYQEVEIPPDWNLRSDTLVLNRHVNASVALGKAGEHVVDFNMESFRASYPRRQISDARAQAHFFNNLGVDGLQAGNALEAFRYFRGALRLDQSLAAAWVNLGTLYWREGYPAHAEASYREALHASPREDVALSNLARLYAAEGRDADAEALRQRVMRHRLQNPYYRAALAREAYDAADYAAAVGHLKAAIRERPDEAQFHSLLGASYLQLGQRERARRAFSAAADVAENPAPYQRKLERLASAP